MDKSSKIVFGGMVATVVGAVYLGMCVNAQRQAGAMNAQIYGGQYAHEFCHDDWRSCSSYQSMQSWMRR
jgi:hypothetical protein